MKPIKVLDAGEFMRRCKLRYLKPPEEADDGQDLRPESTKAAGRKPRPRKSKRSPE